MTYAVWLALVAVVSLYPLKGPKGPPYADKLFHMVLYAITAALFFSYFIRRYSFRKALVWAVGLSGTYGFAMEALQPLAGRDFSPLDGLSNLLGAALAALYIGHRRGWR
jgi:VanZ family protein